MDISLDTWALIVALAGIAIAILNFNRSDVRALRTDVREDMRNLQTDTREDTRELRVKASRLEKLLLMYLPKRDAAEITALLSKDTRDTEDSEQ